MNFIQKYLKPYLILVLIFLFFSFIVKIYEFFSINDISFFSFVLSLLYSFIVNSIFSIIIFLFFGLLTIRMPKFAIIITSIIFSIICLLESGLIVYCLKTGELMGTEFLTRSFSEIIHTIRAATNIFLVVFFLVFMIVIFVFLSLFLQKYKEKIFPKNILAIIFGVLIIIASPCAVFFKQMILLAEDSASENFIINKTYFTAFSSLRYQQNINYLNLSSITNYIEISDTLLLEFIEEFPERQIDDIKYPLEYYSEDIADNLLPFFAETQQNVNVVLLILESFSRHIFYEHEDGISFTPFFDSLENESLSWKNCLSFVPRSFAAYPSIIGSLPLGVSGFQFGKMPYHTSAVKIFGENNYTTTLFYASNVADENMKDLFERNNVKYMPDYYALRKKENSNHWGMHDSLMLNIIIDSAKNSKTPFFYTFVSLSTHDGLIMNEDKVKYYESKTKKIIEKLPKNKQKKYLDNINRIAAYLYLDNCLKNFISEYSKIDNNTIFVLLGDHGLAKYSKDEISTYHVPLVIYSPLLKEKHKFSALVTHNDIIPSLMKLMQNKYQIKIPEKLHYWGNAIDTSKNFNSKQKMIFFDNSRNISRLIYGNYFYLQGNDLENEKLFSFIGDNLKLKAENNDSLKRFLKNKLEIFKKVNYYVYLNDKLYNYGRKEANYVLLDKYQHEKIIVLQNPPENIKKTKGIYIYPMRQLIRNNDKKIIKIDLFLEVMFSEIIPNSENFPKIQFICRNSEKFQEKIYNVNILLNIAEQKLEKDKFYKLKVEREYDISDLENLELEIKLLNTGAYSYIPNLKTSIKNINVEISAQ